MNEYIINSHVLGTKTLSCKAGWVLDKYPAYMEVVMYHDTNRLPQTNSHEPCLLLMPQGEASSCWKYKLRAIYLHVFRPSAELRRLPPSALGKVPASIE